MPFVFIAEKQIRNGGKIYEKSYIFNQKKEW